MQQNKQEKITFGPVHLRVTDAAETTDFWTELMGLQVRSKDNGIELGTETTTLVVLHETAQQKVMRGFSGLYHFAIHIPTEAEFARILARLMQSGWSIAPTDHIMSKAIYLTDPDGITIEITHETPQRFKEYNMQEGMFQVIAADGSVRGATEALDVREVLQHLSDEQIHLPIQNDAYIGHIHFYVPDLQESYDFYKGLGFEDNLITEELGFADLSAGDVFKHRVAMNTWQGKGASLAPKTMAGLEKAVLYMPSEQLAEDQKMIQDIVGNTLQLQRS